MINTLLVVALSVSGSFASLSKPSLFNRQLVQIPCSEQGQKTCGEGCIDLGWTCCPDGAGGCGPTEYCVLGSNAQYGCCPNGLDCSGPGGAITTGGQTFTSTIVNTETTVAPPVSTDEPIPTTTETLPPPVTETPVPTETVAPPETTAPPATGTVTSVAPPAETTTASVPPVVVGAAATNGYSVYTLGGLLAGVFALVL